MQLEACKAELKNALEVFTVHARLSVSTTLEVLRRNTQTRQDEIFNLLRTETQDTKSSYSARKSLSSAGTSSGSLSLLPAAPQIFHGRDAELGDILAMLINDFPRIAILGSGGMGKTSLATAALHNPGVVNKYQNRHFISCDSAFTCGDLVSITASTLSLEPTKRLAKVIARHLLSGPPCLVVLDNFETPWEPVTGRAQVEELLSLLTDIPHVALLITMRGAERPGRVKWTRPFLPPLMPLTAKCKFPTSSSVKQHWYALRWHMSTMP
ncbi:hypothetical protein C8R43DRAFT_1197214, partial [Mycena crocata]